MYFGFLTDIAFLLHSGERLYCEFLLQCARFILASLVIDQLHRSSTSRVARGTAVIVFVEPTLQVIRDAGIEGIVAAFQDVKKPAVSVIAFCF
jgi:hypothetical protein